MRTLTLALVLPLVACATVPRLGEGLVPQVTAYNDGVRWGRLATAAAYVPPAERSDFIDRRDELSDDLRITDYELVRIEPRGDAAARVHVKYVWYLDTEGVVRTTHADQAWARRGKSWLLVDEVRLRGPEMPGLSEPVVDEPGDDGDGGVGADPADVAVAPIP